MSRDEIEFHFDDSVISYHVASHLGAMTTIYIVLGNDCHPR